MISIERVLVEVVTRKEMIIMSQMMIYFMMQIVIKQSKEIQGVTILLNIFNDTTFILKYY
jgi:hypothetical protein